MSMKKIPIYTIRFLDIIIPDNPDMTNLLLNGAKDLAKENKKLFKKKGIKPEVFHNDDIKYSGIQLSRYQGSPEYTAIGIVEVRALKLWYKLFKKDIDIVLKNTVKIQEQYTPEYLNYRKKYFVKKLLINDNLAKELNKIADKFAVYNRLEKYIYGNIMRFLKHIEFEHNPEQKFIEVKIQNIKRYSKAQKVYHQNKKTAFDIRFTCNFRLPQMVSLGQSTALGYGRVEHI